MDFQSSQVNRLSDLVSWQLLCKLRLNICSYTLKTDYLTNEIILKKSKILILGESLFCGMGILVLSDLFFGWMEINNDYFGTILYVAGLIFLFIGLRLLFFSKRPVFSFANKCFYKSRQFLLKEIDYFQQPHFTAFSDIIALQFIEYHDTEFDSYELNLVLKDYSRIHIVTSGSKSELLEDANIIAEKLKIPLLKR